MAEFWKSEATRLLRLVSPADFESTPVYILDRTELDDRFDHHERCAAWTASDLDLRLQPTLESRGEWQGRGFAFVTFQGPAGHPSDYEWRQLVVTLHECVHRFQEDRSAVFEHPVAAMQAAYATMYEADGPNLFSNNQQPRQPPWDAHASDFIRLAIHVSHRANSVGFVCKPGWLWDSDAYKLSQIERYIERLGDEPQRFRDRSLFAVAESPAPEAFQAFADEDLKRATAAFHNENPSVFEGTDG